MVKVIIALSISILIVGCSAQTPKPIMRALPRSIEPSPPMGATPPWTADPMADNLADALPHMPDKDMRRNLANGVLIVTDDPNNSAGHGSGQVISTQGHILTSLHVVAGQSMIVVPIHTATGKRVLHATVVASDQKLDLAVVKIPLRIIGPAVIAKDDSAMGDEVYGIGYPYFFGRMLIRGSVMQTGFLAQKEKNGVEVMRIENASLVDLRAGPGFSGSALFSGKTNRLVGVIGAFSTVDRPAEVFEKIIDGKKRLFLPPRPPSMMPGIMVPASDIRAFLARNLIPFTSE